VEPIEILTILFAIGSALFSAESIRKLLQRLEIRTEHDNKKITITAKLTLNGKKIVINSATPEEVKKTIDNLTTNTDIQQEAISLPEPQNNTDDSAHGLHNATNSSK